VALKSLEQKGGEGMQQPIFFTRGDVARAESVSPTAVTYWEQRGWLTADATTVGGIRLYTQASVDLLRRERQERRG
jgi:DNA-binding transcriptional MerR regulator